ncbi:hypothetical protein [Candidatus Hodgkinia cicadicola]
MKNRCVILNRSKGYYWFFKISRIIIK